MAVRRGGALAYFANVQPSSKYEQEVTVKINRLGLFFMNNRMEFTRLSNDTGTWRLGKRKNKLYMQKIHPLEDERRYNFKSLSFVWFTKRYPSRKKWSRKKMMLQPKMRSSQLVVGTAAATLTTLLVLDGFLTRAVKKSSAVSRRKDILQENPGKQNLRWAVQMLVGMVQLA